MKNHPIGEEILTYIQKSREYESDGKPRELKYYVSDMGGCKRTRWLKRHGVKAELESHVSWIFTLGDLIHEFAYKALEANNRIVSLEETLETEHFKGRLDLILKDDNGENIIADVKSCNSYKIKKQEVDPANRSQLLTYAILKNDQDKKVKKLKNGIIIYLNKDLKYSQQVVFSPQVTLTPDREKELRAEMDEMISYWEEDKIPPCTCPGWMKDYNNYLPLCEASDTKIRKCLDLIKAGKQIISTKTSLYAVSEDGSREELK